MNMWKKGKSFLRNRSEGFTLIEAITTIAVLSILGVVVWSSASLAIKMTDKINITVPAYSQILSVEASLREHCAEVHIPYWLSEIDIVKQEHEITVPYYQGEPAQYLSVKVVEKNIVLTVFEKGEEAEAGVLSSFSFGPFNNRILDVASDEVRGKYGIMLQVSPYNAEIQAAPDEPFKFLAEFASTPFLIGEE